LLAEDRTEDKPSLLLLLASLANGKSYLEVHGPLRLFDGKRDTPEFQRKLAVEKEWVRSTWEAVLRGIPLFVNHLSHSDPDVRACTAHLLGQCQDDVAPQLAHHLNVEADSRVVASIILALNDLGQGDPTTVFRYLDHADFGVRFAAAVFAAKDASSAIPRKAIDILVDVVIDYHLLDPYESLPYAAFNPLTAVAGDTLAALGPEGAGFIAPRLMELLPAIPDYVEEAVKALLGITFTRTQMPVLRENLTEAQRAVLNLLVTTPSVWHFSFQYIRANQLEKYGLPKNQTDLRCFLEG